MFTLTLNKIVMKDDESTVGIIQNLSVLSKISLTRTKRYDIYTADNLLPTGQKWKWFMINS